MASHLDGIAGVVGGEGGDPAHPTRELLRAWVAGHSHRTGPANVSGVGLWVCHLFMYIYLKRFGLFELVTNKPIF